MPQPTTLLGARVIKLYPEIVHCVSESSYTKDVKRSWQQIKNVQGEENMEDKAETRRNILRSMQTPRKGQIIRQCVRFEVFTAVTMKMASSRMLRRAALVRTDVSEELSASIFRVTRIGKLGTMLAETSNRRSVRRFIQEPHGVTSQKTPFFILQCV
jgi:hypothetical protein